MACRLRPRNTSCVGALYSEQVRVDRCDHDSGRSGFLMGGMWAGRVFGRVGAVSRGQKE